MCRLRRVSPVRWPCAEARTRRARRAAARVGHSTIAPGSRPLRIIAGSLRGRRLGAAPPGVRPTSDRVRESVFARLGDLAGARVLDLYAGTGALGLEALSRGADELVAVDRAARSVAAARRNVESLDVADHVRLIHRDARGAIRHLLKGGDRFDLVFLDPPYADHAALPDVLSELVPLLAPDAVVVVECAKRHSLSPTPGLVVEDTRAYGDTSIIWMVPASARDRGGSEQR